MGPGDLMSSGALNPAGLLQLKAVSAGETCMFYGQRLEVLQFFHGLLLLTVTILHRSRRPKTCRTSSLQAGPKLTRGVPMECLGLRPVQQCLASMKETSECRQASDSSIVPREKSEQTDSSWTLPRHEGRQTQPWAGAPPSKNTMLWK